MGEPAKNFSKVGGAIASTPNPTKLKESDFHFTWPKVTVPLMFQTKSCSAKTRYAWFPRRADKLDRNASWRAGPYQTAQPSFFHEIAPGSWINCAGVSTPK